MTDGDLNRRRIKTQASRHINVADVEHADDMMGLLLSFEELQIAAQLLADTVRDWGGELNVKKTKWMCIRSALAGLGRVAHVHVNNEEVEQVDEFRYLGSVVASDADLGQHRDVDARVRGASKVFGQLRGLWGDGRVLLSTKRTIFLACVCTTLFWGAETWTQRAPELQMMRRAWYGWLRSILGLT